MDVSLIALIIFIITYTGVIFTRLPWVNVDRPSAAFTGAVAMILFGVMSFEEAMFSIDFHTLSLLLGMMIMIASFQADGLFNYIAEKSVTIARNQRGFLTYVVLVSGLGSAFFVNDAVVLMFTPVIISICRASGLNPVPYLLAEIYASNVGSAMTITGNPQNMLIGMNSGISFIDFMLHLAPVSLIGMFFIIWIIRIFYRDEFSSVKFIIKSSELTGYRLDRMKFSLVFFSLVMVAFILSKWLHITVSLIALSGAALTLLFGHTKPRRIIDKIDWILILFFASLFIVVHGLVKTGWMDQFLSGIHRDTGLDGIISLHLLSLVGSQVVSNVPYTMILLPVMKAFSSDLLWLTLASAATFAGNATLIGAIANLIVVEVAGRLGVRISFGMFMRTSILVTLLTMILSVLILWLQWSLGLFHD